MRPGRITGERARGSEESSLLAARWRAGEPSALGEMVKRFQGPLLAYAMSLLGSLHEAEDVVQETWIRADRAIADLRDPAGVWAWLRRISHNAAMDAAARTRRQGAPTDPSALEEKAALNPPDAEEHREEPSPITLVAIIGAIESLPETYREAAVYHYLQEWPYSRIAGALGIGEEAARQRVSRAGKLLRSALRKAREEECHDM